MYVIAVGYKDKEYNDAEELLSVIIYKVFQRNSMFFPFQSILIDLFRGVKCDLRPATLLKKMLWHR